MRPAQNSPSFFYGAVLLALLASTQASIFSPLRRSGPLSLMNDEKSTGIADWHDSAPSTLEKKMELTAQVKGPKLKPKPKPKPKAPSKPPPKDISVPNDAPRSGPGGVVIIYHEPEKLDVKAGDEPFLYGGYSVSCGKYATGGEDDIMSLGSLTQKAKEDVTAGPDKCTRVECRGSSAIYYCNHENTKPRTVTQSTIGFMAQALSRLCCQPASDNGEAGEIRNGQSNYSVVVGYGDCTKGDGDGPYPEKKVKGRSICRGKPTPSKSGGGPVMLKGRACSRDGALWAAAVFVLSFLVMLT